MQRVSRAISDLQRTIVYNEGGLLAAWGLDSEFRSHLELDHSLEDREVDLWVCHLNMLLEDFLMPEGAVILPQRVVPLSRQEVLALIRHHRDGLDEYAAASFPPSFRGVPARGALLEMLATEQW